MALYLGNESGRDQLVIDPGIFQAVTAKAAERGQVVADVVRNGGDLSFRC
jgi:hypothetical protein